MIVDGRQIAEDILTALKEEVVVRGTPPHLTVITCAPNFETKRFLALKKRKAEAVGIAITVVELQKESTTDDVLLTLRNSREKTDGIIVQLPLPTHIDTDAVLGSVPKTHDVDVLWYDGSRTTVLPPVVGAIEEIAIRHNISFKDTSVVVLGNGRLVGKPSALWAKCQGAHVSVLTKESLASQEMIGSADILILGAGEPHMVTPEHVKEGVVIFDAGTSESSGVLVGDADPLCSEKASLITPVPNGIGPVTVAVLLRNLLRLTS